MILRVLIRSVDAGAAVIGHAVDHGSAGKHGGDPANIVRRNHACMCLRERRQRERIVIFPQVAVVLRGRGKRACCHMARPRPATSRGLLIDNLLRASHSDAHKSRVAIAQWPCLAVELPSLPWKWSNITGCGEIEEAYIAQKSRPETMQGCSVKDQD